MTMRISITLLLSTVYIIQTDALFYNPTGTTETPPECKGSDQCSDFDEYKEGTFRLNNHPGWFLVCIPNNGFIRGNDGNHGRFFCMPCAHGLYYSVKCDSCEEFVDDTLNVCTTTKPTQLTKTTDYNHDYCKDVLESGNYPDTRTGYGEWFYTCHYHNTIHRWCGSSALYYNKTCDACLWKYEPLNGPNHG